MPARLIVQPRFVSLSTSTPPTVQCSFDLSDVKPTLEDAKIRLAVYDIDAYITSVLGTHEEPKNFFVIPKNPSIVSNETFLDKDFDGNNLDTFVGGTLRNPVFVPGAVNRRTLSDGVLAVIDGVLHRSKVRKDKPWFMSISDKV